MPNSLHHVPEGEQHEDLSVFKPLIANLHVEHIPLLASAVRKLRTTNAILIECHILSPPLFGSYHILYPIHFVDGVRWFLKIPATGYPGRFDGIDARGLASEAQTMQFLKRQTRIPIPEIFHFDASLDNELKCPYILMEFMDGVSLYDCWFNDTISEKIIEQRRVKVLQELASTMVQLDKFTYNNGGQLNFDHEQNPTTISPMKVVDTSAMLDRLETDDPDETGIFCELGPFKDAKSAFLAMLDRRDPPPDAFGLGIYKILRLFLSWIPFTTPQDFVLSHPDFGIQNVLVSEDGSLRGLIDWDGVSAVPRCVGNRQYPSWITRDWDPAKYAWDPDQDSPGLKENSPQELARYRHIYAQAIAQTRSSSDADVNITRNSLILENIRIAADDPICTIGIVRKIFTEIARLVAPETLEEIPAGGEVEGEGEDEAPDATLESLEINETEAEDADGEATSDAASDAPDEDGAGYSTSGFYLYEIAIVLAEGDLDENRLGMLKDGFLRLFV